MADDTILNPGVGGDTIATDDIAGVKHQRVKVTVGADGVNDGDVSTANPMPTDAREVAGNAMAVGSGAASTGTQRVILANDQDAIPINSVVPGTAATNLGKAEDVAHASGDTGVAALAVRRDKAAVGSDADADYSTLNVDQHGMLRSVPGGVESPGNTSTTPLVGSATFTGTGEQNDLPDVMVSLFTDQTGTLFFDFSVNGSDWRTFPTAGFAISANTHAFHTAVKGPRYFRARLMNNGTPQTVLQLFTYFGTFAGKPNAPIGQSVSDASDATTVKAVIVGDSGGGVFVNVGVTAGGNFKIDFEDLGGNAVDVDSGVSGIGTQRVILATDQSTVPVSVASLPLPTGAATAAGQLPDGHNVTVDNASLVVDGSAVTQPVSAVALPLPAGAATSALQLPDGHNVTIDNTVAAPANVQISDGTETALVSAAGALVVDGSGVTQPVSAASLPLPTGAATAAAQLADGHNVTADAGTGDFDLAQSHTRNEAFKESAAIGGELDDTTTVVATEGNVSPARITAQRALHSNLRNAAGTEIGTAAAPVRIDPTGTTTQPISASSLPLPAGAATAAAQLADGHNVTVDNVAAAAVNCTIVDAAGDSAMDGANDAVRVNIVAGSGSGTEFNEDDMAAGGEAGPAILGVRRDADTTPVTADGDFHQLIFDAAGNLKVNVKLGGGTGGTSSAFAAAFPGTGTAAGWDDGTNMQGPRVFDADTGGGSEFVAGTTLRVPASGGSIAASFATGVRDAGTQRVTIATNDLVPISAASLPLPTGAATSAGQLADGHNVTIDNTAAGAVNSTIVDGAGDSAMDDANNALRVNLVAGGGGGGTNMVDDAVFTPGTTPITPAGGTYRSVRDLLDDNDGGAIALNERRGVFVSLETPGSVAASYGTGVRDAGTQRVTVATDDLVPISAASLPLPAGAATSALQLADGHNVTADAGTGDFLSIAAHTTNEALKEAMAIAGQFDDAATTVATEDNVAPVRITAQRALHANLRNVAGTEIGTAAAPVRTDPTGTTTQPVDGSGVTQPVSAVALPLPAGAATSAGQLANGHDVTVDNTVGAPANVQLSDGTDTAEI